MWIDAHCHLTADALLDDSAGVIQKARTHGVRAFVSAATQRSSWAPLSALCRQWQDSVFGAFGLHPWFDHHLQGADNDLDALKEALEDRPAGIVALGECGVDKRRASEGQWVLFDAQLALAGELGLPVIIHCVQLNDEVAKCLRQHPRVKGGLIHGFAGSPEQAQRFNDLGYLVGIGGAVTFDRAQKLKRVVASLPDDGFLLETDSPDMLPASLRSQGGNNTPANLPIVAREVARLRNLSLDSLAATTSANAARLFNLPLASMD